MLPAPAATVSAGALGADARRANRPAPDGALTRARFRLSGLHCATCAGLVESLLYAQRGVKSADVHPSTQTLVLDWWPERVTLDELRQALAPAGYDFVPDLAGPARDLRRREHRQALWRLFVAGFLMMQVMMLAWPSYVAEPGELAPDQAALLRWGQWVLTLPVMLLAAGPFFRAAFTQLRGRRLGMDVPVALGLGVAFVAGSGATLDPGGPFGHEVYFDSITMFVTFLLGARYLELRSRHRAAAAVEQAAEALPDEVERVRADGAVERVAIEALAIGDRVRVAAGQRMPADAIVESGVGATDESLLTGESRPVWKAPGDVVLAGSLNLSGVLTLCVRQVGEQTRLAGIRQLMAQAFQDRPTTLRTADRVAGWFLAGVLVLAGAAALAWQFVDPSRAVAVAVSVLIVTCPCALSLAAPAAWVAAAGALARRGLLLSRLDAIESLADVDRIVMDKTGTLTDPAPRLRPVRVDAPQAGADPWDEDAMAAAAVLAAGSLHPLSRALAAALPAPPGAKDGWTIEEFSGRGLEGRDAHGRHWRLGSSSWAADSGRATGLATGLATGRMKGRLAGAPPDSSDAQIVLTCEGVVRIAWHVDEHLREGAPAAIAAWRAMDLAVELLSGDAPARVEAAARAAGIAHWHGGARPEDKLQHVTALQARGHHVLMIGDGINDAPVLARAQVSVAMGQGADLAKARADAVLTSDRLDAITAALRLARRTRRVVRQNLAWSALYNAVCVPMALVGWLPPWAAGLGMATSSLLVVANAARLGREAVARPSDA
ncbi:heavy metal translocating P-type ATPase [Roseateles chitinivorans]|uniref:heavy metal translocating P-type ATPase n=1 Tax=Roseateles chitinivorans TaxID=2917965 RepID=UPI003D6795E4